MNESSEFIKNSDHCLQTFIANQVVQKRPIFKSYKKLCKLVGQDAMKYPDFEYWYYRFYHGEMDFDYDRSLDPVPKTIMDMPVSLIYKITKNLDPVERAYLRFMNKSIKNVADSHPPFFEKINICVLGNTTFWNLNKKFFNFFPDGKGCKFFIPNKTVRKSKECLMKKSLEYLTPLFKIHKIQVHHFSLALLDENQTLEGLLPVPFFAKNVEIHTWNMDQIFPFLLALNPGELESIHLKTVRPADRDQILTVFETEQFKQAKHVQLRTSVEEDDLLKFSHLKSFKCSLDSEELVDIQRVREIISNFEQFESCELIHHYLEDEFLIRSIGEALGEDIPFGPLKTIPHRYQIRESNECLEFKIEDTKYYYCTIKIFKIR